MNQQTIVIRIDGMTCGHCSNYVSQIIGELEGIVQTDISLEQGTATVRYDADQVSSSDIAAAVGDTHYTVLDMQNLS